MDRYLLPLVGRLHAGDGEGVTGGKNGVGRALQRFMVRIRIPNGFDFPPAAPSPITPPAR
jgi:hypothetical protein